MFLIPQKTSFINFVLLCFFTTIILTILTYSDILADNPDTTQTLNKAKKLRIVSYNLNWLGVSQKDRQRFFKYKKKSKRTHRDLHMLKKIINTLDADIFAIQEVNNVDVLAKIFHPKIFTLILSQEDDLQRTGFAIRKNISFQRNNDFKDLDIFSNKHSRRATDITVFLPHNETLRILSVHLKSGCYSLRQNNSSCDTLKKQFHHLAQWKKDNENNHDYTLIVGDFNRRLVTKDPLLQTLDTTHHKKNILHIFTNQQNDLLFFAPFIGRRPKCWNARFFGFIDHFIMVSHKNTHLSIRNVGEFVYDKTMSYKKYAHRISDHCPIFIDLG